VASDLLREGRDGHRLGREHRTWKDRAGNDYNDVSVSRHRVVCLTGPDVSKWIA
jgi:hypothetical protein